ncbi:MAG: prepilin-type N-terminal cleavage/methylation domain-containing protein [Planctomycetes bacterium]|nr:prepilin-type N-terminal cleavage/methylation domain-containing protein [Planctomycetota bacterium]
MNSYDLNEKNLNGFTLVELVLAIVILTIGIMALMTNIMPAMKLEETSRSFDIAKSAATDKLEEIAGYDFDSICTVYSGTNFAASELGDNAGYISIDNSNTELLDITVTISWWSGAFPNTPLSLQMKTMLTRSDQ